MNNPPGSKVLIERRPLSLQIYEWLEDHILAGKISPGTKLAEEAIAEQFGVSRSPAREAIILLERAGLAEKLGHRDRRVVVPSRKTIVDVYATWIILETGRMYLSSLAATKKQHNELRRTLKGMEAAMAANDPGQYQIWFTQYHDLLTQGCDNLLLNRALGDFERHRKWLTTLYYSHPENSGQSFAEHRNIAKHYMKRDMIGLIKALEAHMQRQRDSVLARLAVAGKTEH